MTQAHLEPGRNRELFKAELGKDCCGVVLKDVGGMGGGWGKQSGSDVRDWHLTINVKHGICVAIQDRKKAVTGVQPGARPGHQ